MSARVLLAAVLVGLCAWQLALLIHGPQLPISHDELNFLFEALRLPAQRRLESFMHGPLTFEILAVLELGVFVVLKVVRVVHTPVEFLASVMVHLGTHLALARLVVGAFGIGCIIQVYKLGRRFAPVAERADWVGAGAALLCAANLTFTVFSSTLKEDAIFWFWIVWAMNRTWDLTDEKPRAAWWAGAALGLAFSTKYFGIFAMLLCIVPLVRFGRRGFALSLRMAAGAAAAVVITFPFLFFQTRQVLAAVQRMGSATAGGGNGALLIGDVLGVYLPDLVGWGVLLLALPELGWRLYRDRRGPIVLGVLPLAVLAFLGLRPGHTQAYYFFPVALFLFVLASASVMRWSGKFFWLPLVVCLASNVSVRGSLKWDLLLMAPDTRVLAREKIEATAPANARVLVTGAVTGMSYFGPWLRPVEPPLATGSGTFAQGQKLAIDQMSGPRYQVKLINGFEFTRDDTREVDFVAAGRFGEISHAELGDGHPWVGGSADVSSLEPIAEITAHPPLHTYAFPCLTALDYDELSRISLSEMWKSGARGPSFTLYRRR